MMSSPVVSPARRAIPATARESRWALADGHELRRLDFAVPKRARGSILFMPGRGDIYEKWLETLDGWHREGWQVTSADWRGQGGSGRLGADKTTAHIDDFATWITDYAQLYADWVKKTPAPHVVIGHSMGGHLVLRAVAEGVVKPDAVVLSAPMLGIHPAWIAPCILHKVAGLIAQAGDPRRPAWQGGEKPGSPTKARILMLTHDETRFEDEAWWFQARPHLRMGASSWGWVEQAFASILMLNRAGVLENVDVPVQILGTSIDALVAWGPIRRAAKRLPHAELVAFGAECRHEILREVDPVRARALAAIKAFLDRHVPARG